MYKSVFTYSDYLVPEEGTGVLSKDIAATFMRNFWYCDKPLTVKQKYIYISKIFTNMFIDDDTRAEYLTMLCASQRKYFALMRFVRMCMVKRAKVQIRTNLCLDDLEPNNRRTFVLFQSGRLFYFAISDLVKILINSVSHSSFFFLVPIRAKNPYNNMAFTKADLYNIYFKIKETFLIVPRILELYFLYDFDIYALKKHHETELFFIMVDNYLNNNDAETLMQDYKEMLEYTRMSRKICVDEDYPKDKLMKIMRPFLRLHLIVKYVCDIQLRYNYESELAYRLRFFHKTNPLFGRKIIRANTRNNHGYTPSMAERRNNEMVFMEPSQICLNKLFDNFLNSHLYAEYNFNSFISRGFYNDTTNMDNYGLLERNGGYQPVFRNSNSAFSQNNASEDNVSASISLTPEQVQILVGDNNYNEDDASNHEDEETIVVQDSDNESESGSDNEPGGGEADDDDDETACTGSDFDEEKEEDYDW